MLLVLLQKKTRTKKRIKSDYDLGIWKKTLEGKRWLAYKEITSFVQDAPDTRIFALMNGRLETISHQKYQVYRANMLHDIIKKIIEPTDEIIELGCGYGFNLFSLVSNNITNPMWGYDISHNAIKTGNEINDHYKLGIKFGECDIINDLDKINIENKVVLTYYSLEQLKYHTGTIIDKIIKGKPKEVIHIEPVMELYGNTIQDRVSKLYMKAMDYQDNLFTTLLKLEKENMIKILQAQRLGYAANPLNEASLIRWIPSIKN